MSDRRATATAAAATAAEATAAAAAASAANRRRHRRRGSRRPGRASHARSAALLCRIRYSEGVAAAAAAGRPLACLGVLRAKAVRRRRPLSAPGPLSRTRAAVAAPGRSRAGSWRSPLGLKHLIAAAAAEVHPVLTPPRMLSLPNCWLHVRVVVSHALTMLRIVLPVVAVRAD